MLQSPYATYALEKAVSDRTSAFFLTRVYNVIYLVGLRVVVEFLIPFIILIVSNVAIVRQLSASQK